MKKLILLMLLCVTVKAETKLKIIDSNELDIEFGITRNDQIVIFQVRPITSLKSADKKNLDNKISNLIIKESKIFSNLNKKKSCFWRLHNLF